FVVILESTAESQDIEVIAQTLLSALSQPVQLSGHECHTTASIGIAMFPEDGTDVQTLTKNADMAMYLAKGDGKNGFRFFTLAVNLSPRQFADEGLLHDIDDALGACGMSPTLLQIEITESMVMQNVSRAVRILDAIRGRGIRLAIDDFGTGYSSMSLMKQFPIDTIKIDRSFVRDLPIDSEDQAIAQAIISMGKALGMTVIAEGVETVEQETFLRNH